MPLLVEYDAVNDLIYYLNFHLHQNLNHNVYDAYDGDAHDGAFYDEIIYAQNHLPIEAIGLMSQVGES